MAEHLSQSELDYPFKLLEYINGFRVSQVIFSACDLGVFDLFLRSPTPLSAEAVARELGASEGGTERLLDVLAGFHILEVEVVEGKALYSGTDVSNLYLSKAGAKSLYDMIVYFSQTIYPLWGSLADAIRSDEEMLKFMGFMNSTWVIDGHDVVTAFDLSPFNTIIILGGCSGALAREVTREYPAATVTVLDSSAVLQAAREHFLQADDTIQFQEGKLALVIRTVQIYGTRLPRKLIFSLNMLVQTGGQEHPPSHYCRMMATAGFHGVQVRRTGKCYDAILGIK
ncbi:acetylserotonin O-methyltransferase-like [Scleropages formosus]|uniref:Acetylserotonin O-methyltransferase n=1 Tax=Scleropages formosus TaxID=113540 RepID=A0A0N8K083_SCLFO|nr:acetylserotonin O-methyltransferase-like [Scleropages formosus]